MSDFKNCPYCGKLISSDATTCKHCGAQLVTNQTYSYNTSDNYDNSEPAEYTALIILSIATLLSLIMFPFTREAFSDKYFKTATEQNTQISKVSQKSTGTETASRTDSREQKRQELLNKLGFNMTPMNRNFANYLYKKGFKDKAQSGKKMVIYSSSMGHGEPEEKEFLQEINKYKNAQGWKDKYTFVEDPREQVIQMNASNRQGVEEMQAFLQGCTIYCVVDFNDNTVYNGRTYSTKELYAALYAFYNK